MRISVLCLLLAACVSRGAAARHERVGFGPEPAWVIAPELASTNVPASGAGEVLMLVDQQVNVATGQQFNRLARKILNQSRLKDVSKITLSFDPTFSRFDLHRLDVRRGQELVSRLKPEKIEILQREKNLERDLYDGSLSVLALLDDVRVGDQIEYSYTITGTNPVFGGKFSDTADLGSELSIANYRYRLLFPAGRTIHYQVTDERFPNFKPAVRELPDSKEYVWTRPGLAGIDLEPSTPAWYDPCTTLRLSEFNTWAEVADWAAATFTTPARLSDELDAQIKVWDSLATPEQKLVEALQFVQDQVRYLGIEVGARSHQPSDPSLVFSRRFGDCKDKAVLLCAIFNRLGVDATPALVNAYGGVDGWHPSPLAFNHVIARVKRGEEELWLDPTLTYQRGALDERSCPQYGHALLAQSGVKQLAPVRPSPKAAPKITVRETISLTTNQAAEATIVSTYEGANAENFRAALAQQSLAQITKARLSLYAQQFPLVETQKPIEIDDRGDRIRVVEWYRLPKAWAARPNPRAIGSMNFEMDTARTIAQHLYIPSVQRKMPLAIHAHPSRIIHITTVTLPERTNMKDEKEFIAGPADELSFKQLNRDRAITLEFDYRTRADSVPVAGMKHHVSARDRMHQLMGLSLSWMPPGDSSITYLKKPKGPAFWISIGFAGFMVAVFRFIGRRRNSES